MIMDDLSVELAYPREMFQIVVCQNVKRLFVKSGESTVAPAFSSNIDT